MYKLIYIQMKTQNKKYIIDCMLYQLIEKKKRYFIHMEHNSLTSFQSSYLKSKPIKCVCQTNTGLIIQSTCRSFLQSNIYLAF